MNQNFFAKIFIIALNKDNFNELKIKILSSLVSLHIKLIKKLSWFNIVSPGKRSPNKSDSTLE